MNSSKKFDKLTQEFDDLVKKEKLDINVIEDLMLDDLKAYKKEQKEHVENLLKNHIDEKELISKKNRNGKNMDLI